MLLVNPALRSTFSLGPDVEGRAALEADSQRRPAGSILERAGKGLELRHRRDRDQRASRARRLCPRRLAAGAQQAAARACSPCSSTSARSGGSRRCARTSSPTSRTSCARRSRRCARPSRRCASRSSAIRAPRASLRRHHRSQRPAAGRARRGPARSVAHRVARSTAPTWRRCRCAPVADQVVSLLRPQRRGEALDVGIEIPADLPPARADRKRARAGVHQPARQRVKYCGPGTQRPAPRAARRGTRARRDRRHRPRHRAAPPAAPLRALLPRRRRPLARHGRHRPRPLDRQAPRRGDERHRRRREHRPAAAPSSGSRCRSADGASWNCSRFSSAAPRRRLSHIRYTAVSRPWQGRPLFQHTCQSPSERSGR